jgi:hypothetical protein
MEGKLCLQAENGLSSQDNFSFVGVQESPQPTYGHLSFFDMTKKRYIFESKAIFKANPVLIYLERIFPDSGFHL